MATYTVYRAPIPLYWDSYKAEARSSSMTSTLKETGTYNVINSRKGADGVMLYALASLIDGKTGIGWIRDDDNLTPSTAILGTMEVTGTNAITINRVSTALTHTLEFYVSGTKIKTATGVGGTYGLTFSTAEQSAIYSNFKNTDRGTLTVYVTTYNGSSQVGSKTSTSAQITIPSSIMPKFNAEPLSEIVKGYQGVGYQGVSQIKVTATNVSPGQGATIVSTLIAIGGYQSKSNTYTSPIINSSGHIPITVTITDSRSRTVSINTSAEIKPYKPMRIETFTVSRNGDGTVNTGGVVYLNGGLPMPTYKLEYRQVGTSTWTQAASGTTSGPNDTTAVLNNMRLSGFQATKPYEFRYVLTDSFGNTVTVTAMLGTDEVPMSMGTHGIGVGVLFDNSGADLQVGTKGIKSLGPIEGLIGQVLQISISPIPSLTDWDTLLTTGIYFSDYNDTVQGMPNSIPSGRASYLLVIATKTMVYQEARDYYDNKYIRRKYGSAWSAWKLVI